MKLVANHHSDILVAINECNMDEAYFNFIKRKGRIFTPYRFPKSQFAYLRKKETMLDPTSRDWKHIEWYKIKVNNDKEQHVDN
jgi:hypothetical protein